MSQAANIQTTDLLLSDLESNRLNSQILYYKAISKRWSELIDEKDSFLTQVYYTEKVIPEWWYRIITNKAEYYFALWKLAKEANYLIKKEIKRQRIDFNYRLAKDLFKLAFIQPIEDTISEIYFCQLEESVFRQLYRRAKNIEEMFTITTSIDTESTATIKEQFEQTKTLSKLTELVRRNRLIDKTLGNVQTNLTNNQIELDDFILWVAYKYSQKRGHKVLKDRWEDLETAILRCSQSEAEAFEFSGRRIKRWEKALNNDPKLNEKWINICITIMLH